MKKKFKVWAGSDKDSPNEEICYLRLLDSPSLPGSVELVCVTHKGERADRDLILVMDHALKIIVTISGISNDVPLKTDLYDTPLVYTDLDIRQLKRDMTSPIDLTEFMERVMQKGECAAKTEPTLN